MNNMINIIKIQLLSFFGINKALHSNDKKQKLKLIALALLFVFVFVSLFFTVYLYFSMMADGLEMMNCLHLLLAFSITLACIITLVTSIYKTSGLIFSNKDNDLLMSLPIKSSTIICSRIIVLYVFNLAFIIIGMLPAFIIYASKVHPDVAFYVIYFVTLLFVPLIPIIIAVIIGSIITAISSRLKHSSIITLLLYIIFFVGVMLLSANSETFVLNISDIANQYANMLYKIYPPAKYYMEALIDRNLISLVLFIVISLGLIIAFTALLSKIFKKVITGITTNKSKSHYQLKELKQDSIRKALYTKELKRYFSSPMYVLNTGIGALLMIITTIALLFIDAKTLEGYLEIPGFADMIHALAPIVLSVFTALSCTTACSISLEGKNLWLLQSLPLRGIDVFLSKIFVNLTILVPTSLLSSFILLFVLKTNIVTSVFLFLTPIAYGIFISFTGVFINLKMPMLHWTNEVIVIKQSASTIISMLCGVILLAIPFALYFLCKLDITLILFSITIVMYLISFILYLLLKNNGDKMLLKLQE